MVNQTFYFILFAIILLTPHAPPEIAFFWQITSYLVLLCVLKLEAYLANRYQLSFMDDLAQLEILTFIYLTVGTFALFWQAAIVATVLYLVALCIYYPNKDPIKASIPLLLSFVILSILLELNGLVPAPILVIAIVLFCILFLPIILLKTWGCTPLIMRDIESLCEHARFKHGGIYQWNIASHQLTAGIIGIFPKTRFLLLSPNLVKKMPIQNLKAVIAHEICHSQKFHLVLLPIILSAGLVPLLYFEIHDSVTAIFMLIFFGLYFRIVYGFYSRLFERQADLYGLALRIPLEDMMEALNIIAWNSGNLHTPCWHHYSLFERIEFLRRVSNSPHLAESFNQKVKLHIFAFFILLFAILIFFEVNP